jgi:enediyne biosynthesis protein E4
MRTPSLGPSLFGISTVLMLMWIATGCETKNNTQPGSSTSPQSSTHQSSNPRDSTTGKTSPGKNSADKKNSPAAATTECFLSAEPWSLELGATLFRNGEEKEVFSLPETLGGGLAFVDFDRDGRLDLASAGGGIPDPDRKAMNGLPGALLRRTPSNNYHDCRTLACLDFSSSYNDAIIANDYDNDGFVDLLVTGFSSLQLFRNQGEGTFESTAQSAGLLDGMWSSGAAFLDADGDGDLDLYVAHYANWGFDNNPVCRSHHDGAKRDYCGPREFVGLQDIFYENGGDGSFSDATGRAGMVVASRGLGVLAADLNDDNLVDIYVANDVADNLFYRNKGNWKFDEMGV